MASSPTTDRRRSHKARSSGGRRSKKRLGGPGRGRTQRPSRPSTTTGNSQTQDDVEDSVFRRGSESAFSPSNHSHVPHSHDHGHGHGHGGDDETKPREERSYLEFFPFLNTELQLTIVDASPKAENEDTEGLAKELVVLKVPELALLLETVPEVPVILGRDNSGRSITNEEAGGDKTARSNHISANHDLLKDSKSLSAPEDITPVVERTKIFSASSSVSSSLDSLQTDITFDSPQQNGTTQSEEQGLHSNITQSLPFVSAEQTTSETRELNGNGSVNKVNHDDDDDDEELSDADDLSDTDELSDADADGDAVDVFFDAEQQTFDRREDLMDKDEPMIDAGTGLSSSDLKSDLDMAATDGVAINGKAQREDLENDADADADGDFELDPSVIEGTPNLESIDSNFSPPFVVPADAIGDSVLPTSNVPIVAEAADLGVDIKVEILPGHSSNHSHGQKTTVETPKDAKKTPANTLGTLSKDFMAKLPKTSFRRKPREDDDVEEYQLPIGHNVRYIEPTEMELAERVEYDMDEQDLFWLKAINTQRKKEDLGEVSAEVFEKIFDRLEKEWFDLTKNIPKPTENLPPEDSACNICDDGECENSNAIVFCDGCNLAVHQDCYGIPYIPEGQWLCRKCMLSPQKPVSCIFCPSEGGAFKQTTDNRWAHLLCSTWIPEVGVANAVYMEPIDNVEDIPQSRWKLGCYICKLKVGACIQCETKNCFRAFHVTCARKAHLFMKSKLTKLSSSGTEVLTHRAHCHKHTPRDYRGSIDLAGAFAAVAAHPEKKKRTKVVSHHSDDDDYGTTVEDKIEADDTETEGSAIPSSSANLSKAARAHNKHYSPGAPLAPNYIVQQLMPFVTKLTAKNQSLRKKSMVTFLHTICKYWSLKRESRRGAPLLKRLHLEPWTASASAHRHTEEEKLKKFQTLALLRSDLEKVRMLAELVRKRERAKLKRQEIQNRYLSLIMFPLNSILERTMEQLESYDSKKYFLYPITAEEVYDYHDVISNPICMQEMNEKIQTHQYTDVDMFIEDARRIYSNCMTYNKPDTTFYRAAARQSKMAEVQLEKAKSDYEALDIDPVTGFWNMPIDREIFSYEVSLWSAGDNSTTTKAENPSLTDKVFSETNVLKRPRQNSLLTDPNADSLANNSGSMGRTAAPTLPPPLRNNSRPLRSNMSRAASSAPLALQSGSSSSISVHPLEQPPVSTNHSAAGDQHAQDGSSSTSPQSSRGSSSKHPFRPEQPKPKSATITRGDIAKAKLGAEPGQAPIQLESEEDLLEKLKGKSKKSRTLAASLQSKLKPSIVDKAVIIDKQAPKGWAYVVVEGEDESDEDADISKGGNQPRTPPAPRILTPEEIAKAEEAKRKREEAKEKKRERERAKALHNKARREARAAQNALKAAAAAAAAAAALRAEAEAEVSKVVSKSEREAEEHSMDTAMDVDGHGETKSSDMLDIAVPATLSQNESGAMIDETEDNSRKNDNEDEAYPMAADKNDDDDNDDDEEDDDDDDDMSD